MEKYTVYEPIEKEKPKTRNKYGWVPEIVEEWFTHPSGRQCCGWDKKKERRCSNPATHGTTVCARHGSGMALANMKPTAKNRKHGRYAQMQKGLLEKYEVARRDPEILALREEIHLIDAMIAEALETVDAGMNTGLWGKAREQYRNFQVAMVAKDDRRMRESFANLEDIINTGNSNSLARDQVMKLIDQRKRIVESERKRYIEMKAMVTTDELILMVQRFGEILKLHIKDPDILRAIATDMDRTMRNRGPVGRN